MSEVPQLEEYKFGFHDDVKPVFSTGEGLTEDVVRAISARKEEPEWMLDFRLKSLEAFEYYFALDHQHVKIKIPQ